MVESAFYQTKLLPNVVAMFQQQEFTVKFLCNETSALFFTGKANHNEMKTPTLFYSEEGRSNALAGTISRGRIDLHAAPGFSEERARTIVFSKLLKRPELLFACNYKIFFQGKPLLKFHYE